MKYTFAVALMLCTTFAHAQKMHYSSSESVAFQQKVFKPGQISPTIPAPTKVYLPGEKMRNAGRLMTLFGSALFVSGIVVLSNAESTSYSTGYTSSGGNYEQGDPQAAIGVAMITGGAGLTVPGIILWSRGSKKYKKHLEKEQSVRMNARSNGVVMRYYF